MRLTDTMPNAQNPFTKLFDTLNQRTETYLFVFLKKKYPICLCCRQVRQKSYKIIEILRILIQITPLSISMDESVSTGSDKSVSYGRVRYRKKPIATPPSTFKALPVDLCNKPPTKAKAAFAISSGKMISLSKVRLA